MAEFEVDDLFDGLPGPDYNVAPTVAVPAIFERRVKTERPSPPGAAPAGPAGLGAGAVLGQGAVDRIPDDQRPAGDRGGEAGVPQGVQCAALPAAGRRVL